MSACRSCSWATAVLVLVLALAGQSMAETLSVQDSANADENFILAIGLVKERLAAQPENSAVRSELARLLGWAGRYDEALAEYDDLINAHSDDVDYALGRAQVLAWLGNDTEALKELERATNLAPDYEAVWQLRFRLLRRQQPAADSAELAALRTETEARFPQSRWWRVPPLERDIRWQLTLGAAYEYLSNDLPDWNNLFLRLDWLRDRNARYFLRFSQDARFDNSDSQFVFGGEWRLPGDWAGGLEFNSSTTANFQPKSGTSLHVSRQLDAGWGVDLRWRQRRFDSATVSTYTGTVERYFGNYRAAYGMNLSHVHGLGDTLAHTLVLNWYVTRKHSFGIILTDGEEAEAVGTGQVLQTAVASITFSGRHLLNERLTLAWWAGSHRQGDLYRRNYAGLAVTVGI